MKKYVITFNSGNQVELEADDLSIQNGIVIFTAKHEIVCAFSLRIMESFLCKK